MAKSIEEKGTDEENYLESFPEETEIDKEELKKSVIAEEEEAEKKEQEQQSQKKKRSWKSIAGEILLYALIAFVCIFVIPKYVVQRTYVSGESMENTLESGDHILVEKVSYYLQEPKRYDVVVFEPYGDKTKEGLYGSTFEVEDGREQKEYYVKRVIGLPGETIQIKGETIYINGEPLKDEHYGKDPITYEGIAINPIKLGDNEYFLLGDNREVSLDSRYEEIGPVKRQYLVGKACIRILPLNKFGFFE